VEEDPGSQDLKSGFPIKALGDEKIAGCVLALIRSGEMVIFPADRRPLINALQQAA
jgi:hypothetical protein